MGRKKKVKKLTKLNRDQLETAANMLKALAHPARIEILEYLDSNKRLTVTEIHKYLGLEQSSTSHHLGILRDKGILKSQRAGKNTYYTIRYDSLANIIDCIGECTLIHN